MKRILFAIFIFLILGLGIGGYFLVYVPYTKINAKLKIVIASAKNMKKVFSENNIDLLNSKINDLEKKYADFENEAMSVYWATFIPHVKDFKSGVEAGRYVIKAGKEAVTAITPYADLIGFKKGQSSFVEKSSEDRLQTAILTLDKVLGKIDVISEDIRQAETRIDSIDANRYPNMIGKIPVRSMIVNLKEQFVGMSSLFIDAKPLLKKIPDIFGKDKEKTYLILFQNDKELRATGGFLTAYAVFNIKNGKIKIARSSDIYSLDNTIAVHPPAPREILAYHKGVDRFYIRDSNLSPDFVKSLELFESLNKKSGEKVVYDGVFAIDTKILVDMLTIFGDTETRGIRFSSQIDKRCNCPSVIYTLLDEIDRPVGFIKADRKGILGDLMYALFYKAIGFSPSKYWGTLVQTMFKNLDEKHILLNFIDKDIQQSIEKLNYAGRIRAFDGDYLHINNVNFAGAKSNLFVRESISSKTTKNANGEIEREVTIEFRNPYPHSDCNLERGGLCINAILRNWIRIYVPEGSKLREFKGSEKKVLEYSDLGKTVFEGFLQVNPEGVARVNVTYILPKSLEDKAGVLLIQRQPGTADQKLKVEINGKKAYDGMLIKDMVVKE